MLSTGIPLDPCVRFAISRLGAEVFIFSEQDNLACEGVFWHVKVKIEVTQVRLASVRAEPSVAARAR
jgi:hypothetical protein